MTDPVRMPRGGRKLTGARVRPRLISKQEIPVALERVLLLAVQDAEFRAALLTDRRQALETRGLELRPSEVATLEAMPDTVLAATIDRLDPPRQRNQVFAKAVAAAVAGSVIFAASCDTVSDGGVDPDPYDHDAGVEADADAPPDSGG